MKYCTKCKKLFMKDHKEVCPNCSRKLISDPNHFSPVHIVTANGFELERIRAALNSAEIPYSYQEELHDAGIQILNSAPPENCEVFVPISAYDDAVDTLVGIGAIKDDDIPDINEENKQQLKLSKKKSEEEELSPQKARLVRILSAIAFLIILTGVVYFTDFLIAVVKSWF